MFRREFGSGGCTGDIELAEAATLVQRGEKDAADALVALEQRGLCRSERGGRWTLRASA